MNKSVESRIESANPFLVNPSPCCSKVPHPWAPWCPWCGQKRFSWKVALGDFKSPQEPWSVLPLRVGLESWKRADTQVWILNEGPFPAPLSLVGGGRSHKHILGVGERIGFPIPFLATSEKSQIWSLKHGLCASEKCWNLHIDFFTLPRMSLVGSYPWRGVATCQRALDEVLLAGALHVAFENHSGKHFELMSLRWEDDMPDALVGLSSYPFFPEVPSERMCLEHLMENGDETIFFDNKTLVNGKSAELSWPFDLHFLNLFFASRSTQSHALSLFGHLVATLRPTSEDPTILELKLPLALWFDVSRKALPLVFSTHTESPWERKGQAPSLLWRHTSGEADAP